MAHRLAIVGGGNMGGPLVEGLLADGWAAPDELVVVEVLADKRDEWSRRHPDLAVSKVLEGPVDAALIAVKPPDVPAAVASATKAGARRVLSVAAGVTIGAIEAACTDPGVAVVRAMPN